MNTIEQIVEEYQRDHQQRAHRERRWFSHQRSLPEVIENAALARSPSGKRLAHQRRIPGRVLQESCDRLLAISDRLQQATSFEELHHIVASAILTIEGIGALTVYDTALRIGSYLRLEPKKIFLHAGTLRGARALGLAATGEFLEPTDLPTEFSTLRPFEMEDILCIYKHRLRLAGR
jgi:hypothetical protein